jgi:alpha-1,6-mannosyltransferase
MPIKTLHLTNAYHPTSGGVRTFYRALLEAAEEHGRPLRLVVPGESYAEEEAGRCGRVYHVAAPRSPAFDGRYRLLLPHTYAPFARPAVQRILSDEQPDLIEVCDKYSLAWLGGLIRRGWLPGVKRPVLVGLSCERMDDGVAAWLSGGAFARRLTRYYLGHLYIGQFDAHVANSRYTADELNDAMVPRHERPVIVQRMGVDVHDFSPARRSRRVREELLEGVGGGEGDKLLLYAGRLSAEKNLSLLVQTMARLADGAATYRLLVAGDGPLKEWLRCESEHVAPGRVHLLGQVGSRAELADLYANCDVFIHPNPREPFGIAPLEAMASGLPLVAPDTGGVLSYADRTNAWLAAPEGEPFAAAVRAVFSDESVRRAKLDAARRTAEDHAWEKVAAGFFKLYDELHGRLRKSLMRGDARLGLPRMEMRAER